MIQDLNNPRGTHITELLDRPRANEERAALPLGDRASQGTQLHDWPWAACQNFHVYTKLGLSTHHFFFLEYLFLQIPPESPLLPSDCSSNDTSSEKPISTPLPEIHDPAIILYIMTVLYFFIALSVFNIIFVLFIFVLDNYLSFSTLKQFQENTNFFPYIYHFILSSWKSSI